jgi:predicted nucleic acid-binding protein
VIYFDTSYLVRLYFDDPGHAGVRALAATDHLCCALHGKAELVSALHRKLREGALTPKSYRVLLSQFETDCDAGGFRWLPAGSAVLQRVQEVYAQLPATIYLRGADAIHLATAATAGLKAVYSHDTRFLATAPQFGLAGRDIITSA